jgi:sugar phosphate isomerase/epimerase
MVFCIRKAVFTDDYVYPENIGQQIESLGIPIELGLPFDFNRFKAVEQWLPRLAEDLLNHAVSCIAIHAPEGPVVSYEPEDFLSWAHSVAKLSNSLDAKAIVLHPLRGSSMDDSECLSFMLNNIKALQDETTTTVVLETFKGGEFFSYKRIAAKGLPICLDTSHMSHKDAITFVDKRHDQIRHVHLSEAKNLVPHMPVGERGQAVMERLAELQWDGTVCIEYSDRYADEMIEDYKRFAGMFGGAPTGTGSWFGKLMELPHSL